MLTIYKTIENRDKRATKERMMIMKNLIKKVLCFTMVLAMVVMALPAMEVKAYDPAADLGTITISGVTVGNKLKGYKVINITYNSNNTVSYEWATPEIKASVEGKNGGVALTFEEFAKKAADERQRLMSGLPALLEGNGASVDLTEKEAATSTVQWSDVNLGGYLIMPTSSTDVYQIMLAIIQPELDASNNYVTSDETIVAKKAPVEIEKSADDETTGDAKVITYTIVADVPVYGKEATDTTYIIGDKLSAGLDYVAGSLKVYGYTEAKANISGATPIELGTTAEALTTPDTTYAGIYTGALGGTVNGNAQTFALTFKYTGAGANDNLDALNIQTVKLTYQAKLNANAVVGSAGNRNDAIMEYSHYPYTDGNHETTVAEDIVYTFQIDVDKVAANSGGNTKLSGAEFDVYHKVESSDNTVDATLYPVSNYVTKSDVAALPAGSNFIKVGHIATDSLGKASIDNLDAGTYYLVETVAPNGYTLPTTPFLVELAKGSADANFDGTTYVYAKQIENSMGFTLPETGGTGTVIFTVVGVSLMCVAVLAFFLLRKREVSKS